MTWIVGYKFYLEPNSNVNYRISELSFEYEDQMLNQCLANIDSDVYEPRNPQTSHYFRCVEAHFDQLEGQWDDRDANRYGF